MPPTAELFFISLLRSLVELTMFMLIGQGVLALFAGSRRESNFVYRLFQTITGPVIKVTRFITPRLIRDGHVPLVSFFFLFWLWIGLAYYKRLVCVTAGLSC